MTANGLAALVDFLEPLHFTFCISRGHNDLQIFSNPFLIFDPDFLDDISQRIKKTFPPVSAVEHQQMQNETTNGWI